jgi:bifunctional UDP-N-acetylglucosamine pyrophosphorylase/glucosamine-1-phosphate N-acetyltransferase
MLERIVYAALDICPQTIYVVVNPTSMAAIQDLPPSTILSSPKVVFIQQTHPLGTGHALAQVLPVIRSVNDTPVLILPGDIPLISAPLLHTLVRSHNRCNILVSRMDDPTGYGRILMDDLGVFEKIVEEKDCTHAEHNIQLVNSGVYTIDASLLREQLPNVLPKNKQNEYYLTDIFELIRCRSGIPICVTELPAENKYQLMGVNTEEQLRDVQQVLDRLA